MMISPEGYASLLEGASLVELIEKRDELIASVCQFERDCIDFENKELHYSFGDGIIEISPGPGVFYQMELEYLGEVCKLIQKRFNEEYEQGCSE